MGTFEVFRLFSELRKTKTKVCMSQKMCILFFLFFCAAQLSTAQVDPHFSQYYAYPGFVNPALTGVIDGDYRVTAMYRNQWGNMDGGFKTPGIAADINTGKNVNLGVNVMNQSAGNGVFNYLNAYASFAYTGLRFGREGYHRVVIGLSAGAINRKINPSKALTGSQWTPTGIDPSLPSQENYSKTSASSFDAGAGLVYYDATPGKKANIFAGFSAYHLTQPSDPFIVAGADGKLPVRYTAHGGVRLSLSETFSLMPQLLYMKQGNAEEKMLGAYGQFVVNNESDLLVGCNYRFKDAVVPYVGIGYKNFVLGASYDVGISDLSKIAGSAQSFEISLSFLGRKKSKGETVPFVCPRL
jgi:type IX secretion system PorP/SprF family membrane protein